MPRLLTAVFAAATCLFQVHAQEAEARDEPEKLISLREAWTQAKLKASRPIKEKYLNALIKLQKNLTKQDNLGAAVLVRDEIEVLTQGAKPKEKKGVGGRVPPQLTSLRVSYERGMARMNATNDGKYVAALRAMQEGFSKKGELEPALAVARELKVLELEKTKGDYLADLSKVWFRDYRNKTWNNNIEDKFTVQKTASGYEVSCRVATGYKEKLIIFSAENLERKMIASFTIKKGNCVPGIRPRDLRPMGTPCDYDFKPDIRYNIVVSMDDRSARYEINGRAIVVEYKFGKTGYYAFKVHPTSTVVFHDLRFE